jgi:hypothetical protein
MDDLRRIVLALAGAVAILYAVGIIAAVTLYVDSVNRRNDVAAQTARTDMLSQQLCKTISRGRIVSNRTIREPLKYVLEASADALTAAAADPGNTPQARAIYLARAKGLRDRAKLVTPARELPCAFH